MDIDYPRVLFWAFAATVLVALLVAGSTSGAAFGVFNPGWDGASELRGEATAAGADATVLRDVAAYGDVAPNRTVAVVLSPDRAYADGEAARLRSFVRAGGTLVVAEDFGDHGNGLLAAVGADARVDGRLLRDERHNYRSPAMPVARNVSNHSLVADVAGLTLNHGTAVRPNGATVLVRTSGYAYLDADRNGDLDATERMDAYPVATVEQVGDGRVIVVGDPSIAINAMIERPGNQQFVRAAVTGSDRVLLDHSHATGVPPLSAALVALRGSPPLQLLVGVAAVLGMAGWTSRPDAFGRLHARLARRLGAASSDPSPPRNEAALIAYLARSHPDWDRERVRRVVRAVHRRNED